MSLDVYLESPEATEEPCTCSCCGHQHTRTERRQYYSANITHNLNKMAEEAGIYKHLWRPEEIEITRAGQLLEPLREGLDRLKADPERFKKFNPPNGWGSYEGLTQFVESYLEACKENPEALVSASM